MGCSWFCNTPGFQIFLFFGVAAWFVTCNFVIYYTLVNYHKTPCEIYSCQPQPYNCECITKYDTSGAPYQDCSTCYNFDCYANLTKYTNTYPPWRFAKLGIKDNSSLIPYQEKECCVSDQNIANIWPASSCNVPHILWLSFVSAAGLVTFLVLTLIISNCIYVRRNLSEKPFFVTMEVKGALVTRLDPKYWFTALDRGVNTFILFGVIVLVVAGLGVYFYTRTQTIHLTSCNITNCTESVANSTVSPTYGINCQAGLEVNERQATWNFTAGGYWDQELVEQLLNTTYVNNATVECYINTSPATWGLAFDARSNGSFATYQTKIPGELMVVFMGGIAIIFLISREIWRCIIIKKHNKKFGKDSMQNIIIGTEKQPLLKSSGEKLNYDVGMDIKQSSELEKRIKTSGSLPSSKVKLVDTSKSQISDPLNPAYLCSICFMSEKNVVLNCGHFLCPNCSAKVTLCPFCNQTIVARSSVYF